ncbi:hypothetical protein CVT26_005275 [Gymnopilus dilepis]|uniref:Cytochrome P450 n=1 Tax=Gymnopilus dilepis TaxID=231916 RepID=A0A409WHR2_9AGAR|nr:hypothetical protein CVT26_005275 [Gymnopilus dilepis]
MAFDTAAALPFLTALSVVYLAWKWFNSETYKLRHIPTVGSSGVISSYFTALRFLRHGHEIIHEGYNKYYGTAFKVPTMSRYLILVSGPQMVEDIRRATDDQMSFEEAVAETIQTDYTLGRRVRVDHYHVPIVRTPLTRNIAIRFSDIKDEIVTAFSELVPAKEDEWVTLPALATIMKVVCRTSNRLFVGLPLCRDPDYRQLNEQFTIDVMVGARIINAFPKFLRPIVGQVLTKVPASIKRAVNHLRPLIEEQLAQEEKYGKDWPDKPNNLISWLLDEAKGPQRDIEDLAIRVLTINFAAIHTTTNALTMALYNLAAYPEHAEPMREEVRAVIEAEGWSKLSMTKMRKVDSFIKETQRLGLGAVTLNRKVLQDFTFSNGITVPAGSYLGVPTYATHMDDQNYETAHEFRGFRFAEMRDEEGEGLKHQFVALNPTYLAFGAGRHACPGRFFAANEIKAMLAYILLNYDVKFPNNGPRPEDLWIQATISPNRTAQVMFRKRKTAACVLIGLLTSYLASKWMSAATHQLRHIPTIGSSGVILSYFYAFKFILWGHEMIQEGYSKYHGTAFKVPTLSRWLVMVSGPQMIDDIRRATHDQLSFTEAVSEIVHTDYTIGPQIRLDPYHIGIVRTPLTKSLGARFSDIKDEIVAAFRDFVPARENDWLSIPVLSTSMKIVSRTSNRLFVDVPLCRNLDFTKLAEDFTLDVIEGGLIINLFPDFLKPLVNNIVTRVPRSIQRAISHASPLFQAQLEREQELGKDWPNRPNNLITWLVQEAQDPSRRNVYDLAVRLLTVNFTAIHTTSVASIVASRALTHMLYDLAAHPEYVQPMREEVEKVLGHEGWTKSSVLKLRKLDSFIKESQRLAIGGLQMNRKALKDFTFSNGVTVPAGTHIAVATYAAHMDENIYENPHEFQGFRFAELRQGEGEDTKHQLVSLSPEYLTFGTGRHACPGRFFAATELKTMLAYVLLTYDVKLPEGCSRPANFWFQATSSPNRKAHVLFKKRAL